MTKPGPTISARQPRHCETCKRPLPRRAYRRQCATCLKLARGGVQRVTLVRDARSKMPARVIRHWEYDPQLKRGAM